MPNVIFTQNTLRWARGEMANIDEAALAERADCAPLLTWADWELLQELHKERAAVNVDYGMLTIPADQTAPLLSQTTELEREINTLRVQLKNTTAERDRALVQVTVYRKAYYNLRDVTASGQTMADAARIIHEQVTECENR